MGFIFTGCGGSHNSQLESAIEERDSLIQVNQEKDSAIHNLSASFKEIEANLQTIKEHETGLLLHVKGPGDIPLANKDEINRSIKEINDLMINSSERVRSLTLQLKKAKLENTGLSRMLSILVGHIMNKNDDLIALNRMLASKNRLIGALGIAAISFSEDLQDRNDTIAVKEKELTEKDNQLNAVYYLSGNAKELEQMHILDTKGKLVSDFNKEYFKKLSAGKDEFIPEAGMLSRGIVKLLTAHPKDAYEFIKNDLGKNVNIKIKNRDEFWRLSKYLIIETN